MTRKEKMDLLLTKVPEDRREAFVTELREAKTKEERINILEKYDVVLTEEEKKAFRAKDGNEIPDEEMYIAAGGCDNSCDGTTGCSWGA